MNQPIAYFCAEFGFDHRVPIYAGGLGILAGDTFKAFAKNSVTAVGVGLLYRGENITQFINDQGLPQNQDLQFDPLSVGLENVYKDDSPLFIRVHLTKTDVWLRVWKKTFSENVVLYLLDSQTDQNPLSERAITQELYPPEDDIALKQQLLLGIGGVKLLSILGITPKIYHIQEGKPIFAIWQLIRMLMDQHGLDYIQAQQKAREMVVYTNHTLVAAGNKNVNVHLLEGYGQYYSDKMGIDIAKLLELGQEGHEDFFNSTRYALNSSRKASGVSELHTKLSIQNWPEYNWVNVTNGVYLPDWQATGINEAIKSDVSLWQLHMKQKKLLADFVKEKTGFGFDHNWMVMSWARRFAGYKRPESIFADLERLVKLIRNPQKPIMLLMSGKIHRLDKKGEIKLQQLIKHFAGPLSGHAIFIPNYNMEIAQMLTKGSDVWLNTPEIGKEACGTSGMKAIANGVLNVTVPDGWAGEVDWQGKGWVLDSGQISNSLYQILEDQVIPMFFSKNNLEFSTEWLQMMKNSIAESQRFSATRMVNEYQQLLYT